MMEKESTTVGEFVEEQLLDVYRGDIHKILSNVHRDLESIVFFLGPIIQLSVATRYGERTLPAMKMSLSEP